MIPCPVNCGFTIGCQHCWRSKKAARSPVVGVVVPVPTSVGQSGKLPHKCPVCDGSGLVSRPPNIAGDVSGWSGSGTPTYPCRACTGSGVVWR